MGRHSHPVRRRRLLQRAPDTRHPTPKRFRERRPRTAASSAKLKRVMARLEVLLGRTVASPLCTTAIRRLAEIQRTLDGGRRRQVDESVDVFVEELGYLVLQLQLERKGREKQRSQERRPRRRSEPQGPPRKLRHSPPAMSDDTSLDEIPDVPCINFGKNPRQPPRDQPVDPELEAYFSMCEATGVAK